MSEDPNITVPSFLVLFMKMFNEAKYNLKSLNNKIKFMEKTISNVMLLKSKEPFDEEEDQDVEITQEEIDFITQNYLNNVPKERPKEKKREKLKEETKEETKEENKQENKQEPIIKELPPSLEEEEKVIPEKKVMNYKAFLKMKEMEKRQKNSNDIENIPFRLSNKRKREGE